MARLITCNSCGCARPVGGRCPECGAGKHADQRNRAPYRKARAQVLAGQPMCHWCGAPATVADHLVAVSAGGSDEVSNLVPSCALCNARRGAKPAAAVPVRTERVADRRLRLV